MPPRISIKVGDIFSVKINASGKKHFQYIGNDLTQLNGDVIRAFKHVDPIDADTDFSEIVRGEVDFYAHCTIKLGIKMGLWEKVDNNTNIGETDHILFRGTNDYGHKLGEEPIRVSHNWYVWKINDKNFKTIGKLEGKYKQSYIGLVFNPYGILELLKGNKYPINYPE